MSEFRSDGGRSGRDEGSSVLGALFTGSLLGVKTVAVDAPGAVVQHALIGLGLVGAATAEGTKIGVKTVIEAIPSFPAGEGGPRGRSDEESSKYDGGGERVGGGR